MKTFNQSLLDTLLAEARTHGEVEDLYPATPLQSGLLFHALHSPSSDQYSVQLQWTYEGALDAEALKRACQEVTAQHAILRTGFNWSQGDQLIQIVYRSLPLDWESIDLSELSAADQATQVELIQQADRASSFSLDHPPLLRFKLLRLQADRHVFLFNHHHILLDGWSNPILFKQVHETYEHLIQGKGVPYYPIVPYSSYITWLKEQDQALAQGYWQGQLSGIERATDIGIRRANVHLDSNKPIEALGKLTHVYSAKETDQLQKFVQGQQVTLNTLVQLAWGRLLHTYSGGADRTVHGMVVSGRSHDLAGMDQMVGLFINTLPVVLDWGEEVSIAGQLKQLHEQVQQINHHSYVSLAEVQQYASLAGGSLFHSLVVFENYPLESLGEGAVIVSGVKSFEKTNYPLTLTAYVTGGELHLEIGYDQGVFEGGSIERLASHLRSLLTGFMADPEASPQGVSLLTAEEYQQIVYGWNQTSAVYPQDKTVHELFEDQVVRTPEKVALVFEGEELTYEELNGRANQLARAIQKVYQGQTGESLKADTLIAICVERSLEMVTGILGILKVGGAYVPIDPTYPEERIQYMLADTGAQVLLTQGHLSHVQSVAAPGQEAKGDSLRDLLPGHISILYLDQAACYSKESASNLPPVSGAQDLAYVIYTSGTTGKPKGVLQIHQNVRRLFNATEEIFSFNEQDVWTLFHSIAFDFSVWELWGALLYGGKLIIPTHAQRHDTRLYYDLLTQHGVTVLNQTPLAFQQLLLIDQTQGEVRLPLRQIILGGDALNMESIESWWERYGEDVPQLVNMYGITETTVHVTYKVLRQRGIGNMAGGSVIGHCLKDLTAYVLDQDLNPVPLGVSGELYIGGDGVARGYLNQKELTQERFIANPFASQEDKSQGRNLRLYKTGDLVKWLPDGNLVYLGRSDFQVKLRGYRIELGEIEALLSGYGGIGQCVVLMQEAKEEKYLVAYYVLDNESGSAAVTPEVLRTYLQTKLPEYMVPGFFVQLEALPLTVNGKVDRRALPEPDVSGQIAQGYVAPSNEVEQLIQHIWSQVLGLEQIGVYDNFFHIGGHSLKATQVAARLQQTLAKACPVKWLFDYPTIKTLADQLQGGQAAQKVVIPRSEEVGQTVLSYAQKRLWFIDQYQQQQSTNYHIPVVWQLRGALQVSALEQALNQLIERHQSLRTVFRQDASGNAYQMILPLESCQVSLAAEEVSAQERDQRIAMTIQEPFDLAADRLVRVRLLAIVEAGASNPSSQGKGQALERVYTLVIVQHHIVSDGWSMGIWVKELGELYNAALEGRQARLPALSIQYRDYASWEQEYLQGERLQAMLSYWQGQLQGYEDLQLPTDNPRPAVQTYQGAHSQFYIDAQLTEQLKGLCRETGSTLYMVLLAGFSLLLSRYSGQRDIVIGSPIANRWHPQLEHLIGFFVNTLVLRIKTGIQSVEELLEQVKQTTLSAYEHQSLPFEYLVDQLVVERNQSRSPIFQVMFVLQHASEVVTPSLSGVEVEAVPFSYEVSKFDMTLWLVEGEDGIGGYIEYNPGLYNGSTIAQLASHLKRLLVAMVSHRGGDIASLPLLTSEEYQQIVYGWNQTSVVYPQDKTIHELFEDQVSKTPEKVAVVFEDEELTYGELNGRANQLARAIQKAYQDQTGESLKADTLIGICVEASLDMVIGILGILKSGGGYVPIDPSYPAERIQYILADTRVQVLLTQNNLTLGQSVAAPGQEAQGDSIRDLLPGHISILYLDQAACYAEEETSNLPSVSGAHALAYVIYTSGTTGRPKGVMVEHHSVVNRLYWMQHTYQFDEKDKVLQKTPYGFDVSVWEILLPLLSGSQLVVSAPGVYRDPQALIEKINRYGVTKLHFVPSMLAVFMEAMLKTDDQLLSLPMIFCSGEALPSQLITKVKSRYPAIAIHNLYGPTETAIDVTYYNDIQLSAEVIPIGRPLWNIAVYILDTNHQPVPIGVSGELYIGGVGVARGYLNQEELTQERFIANPFASKEDKAQGKNLRLYKTGDLVKWLPDGNLVYLGRSDFQVKLRGYRIELGEIESVLSGYVGVGQCVVLMQEAKEEKYLVAYYVLDAGTAAVTPDALRSYLQARLPEYMVPSFFVPLEELPLTVNGKVDRRALPEPDVRGQIAQGYVAPSNEVEQLIQHIWSQVLALEQIGVYDNFFHIGGHSLKATQVAARIQQTLSKACPVKWLFDYPTIKALAEQLQGGQAAQRVVIPRSAEEEQTVLSYAQKRLWFIDQYQQQQSTNYHIPVVWQLRGALQVSALEQALNQLLERHHSLRTVFRQDASGNAYQAILPLESCQVSLAVEEVSAQERDQCIALTIQEPFDLSADRLVRVRLLEIVEAGASNPSSQGKGQALEHVYTLVIVQHHIVSDGWSMGIWVKELGELYNAALEGRQARLPALSIQYRDYAAWEQEYLQGERLQAMLSYWQGQLQGYEDLQLPTDNPRPAVQTYQGAHSQFYIDAQLTEQLKGLCRETGSTLYMVLLAGFSLLLSRYSGQRDIVIGSPIANRRHPQLEHLIGFFVNTLVLRIKTGIQSVEELLEQVKQMTLSAYEHQSLPFEYLVDQLVVGRDQSRSPIFQVMFVLQHASEVVTPSLSGVEVEAVPFSYEVSKFDMTLSLVEGAEGIGGYIEYNPGLYNGSTIERLASHLKRLLVAMVSHRGGDIASLPLLTSEEYQQIVYGWNQTASVYPQDKTVHELFEEQVGRTPEKVALVFEGEELTYNELNGRANQLARAIQKAYQDQTGESLRADTLIGICVEASLDMVIGMLGILKSGGGYVPIDPSYPQERIQYMIADTRAQVLLTQSNLTLGQSVSAPGQEAKGDSLRDLLPGHISILYLDQAACYAEEETGNLPPVSGSHDLAYIIYTSGSTGNPKGVMVEHHSVANLVAYLINKLQINNQSRISQFSNLSFDVSVAEIYGALLTGASLYILPPWMRKNPAEFSSFLSANQLTFSYVPPSLLTHMPVSASPQIIVVSGEPCPGPVMQEWSLANHTVLNAYGPTETTVWVLASSPYQGENPNTIGRPIYNVMVYVLDQDLNPMPIGVGGELYIGGDGVARGYLNQEELTQERFIANPFASQEDKSQGRNLRLYKSGDLVKWLPDGNLVYLGRRDFQVKLRGYRIELGEIESVLSGYAGIAQCVVLMHEAKEEKHLVAYYVVDAGTDEVIPEVLRTYLQSRLPEYMVPTFFVPLEELPLTVNGKVDRRALPEPDVSGEISQSYVAPRTETEHKLCQVWQTVLGLEQIGVQDNFFHIGGDSILSIQVVAKARDMGLALQVQDIFAAPTTAQLAMRVQSLTASQAEQGLAQGLCPLLPIQQWFFDEQYEYPHHWNQAQLIQVHDRIDPDQLRAALEQLIAQHDSLRLRYRQTASGSIEQYYTDDPTSTYCLEVLDLVDIPSSRQASQIASWGTSLQSQLNYETGPVMAVGIIQRHVDGSDRLLIAIHHLVVDGVSWRILLPDLQTLYSGGSLPSKTHSYQAWANALLAYAQDKSVAAEGLAYWRSVEEKLLSVQLPYKPGANLSQPTRDRKVADLVLDSALTDQLLHKTSHAYNTQINDLLLTAFALALGSLSEAKASERLVGFRLEGHGREQIDASLDLSRTLGWFTSLYPVSLSLPATADLDQLIPSIKEQLRAIPDKGLSYGVLAYLHPDESVRAQLHPEELPRVSFNYLGQFDQSLQEQTTGWQLTGDSSGDAVDQRNHLPNHLDVNGLVFDNQLRFTLAYSTAHFTAETIKILQEQFEQRLKEIVNHCTQRKECYATPSDYPLVDLNQSSLDALLAEACTHGEVEELYPASPLQSGLLFHALHSPNSDQYSVQLQWTYEGALDAEALKRAWQEVIGQHAILRTGFNWSQGDVLQVVYRSLPLDWESIDLSELSAEDQATQVGLIQQADRASGFILDHPPLLRFKLLRLQADRHVFLFNHHHILLDGWSNPILLKQVHETYERLNQGKGVPYYPIVPYSSYISWLEQQDQALAQGYWQGQLSGIESSTDIGIRRVNVHLDSTKPIEALGTLRHVYSQSETGAMQDFVQGQQVTLNTLVQLAWGRLLHTYSGGADRTVHGMVVSGRSHDLAGMDQLVGLFINTLPIVLDWREEVSIACQLKQLHEQVQQINHYSYISLAEVQQYAMLSGGSLFHSLVVFENYPLESPGEGSVIVSGVKSFEKTNYPLTLTAYVTGGELHLAIGYDQGVFEGGSIERLLVHLRSLLTGFMADPEASPQGVSLLTSSEYEEVVYEWNQTAAPYPQDKTVHELFEDQVAKAPDKVAVVFEDEELTYGELNGRANQVARAIQKVYQGQTGESLRADTLIGISVEASLEMVIGMLGILKAGGGYVPIDPAYPAERIQYILSDTSAQVLLTQGHLSHIHSVAAQMPDSISMLYLDQGACYSKEAASNLPSVSGAHDLAYVIYTSGTTGKPKGTLLTHRNLHNLAINQITLLNLSVSSKVLQFSAVGFDALVWEMYSTLVAGASLYIVDDATRKMPMHLGEYIQQNQLNVVTIPPALLEQFPKMALPALQVLIVAGESCHQAVMEYWHQGRKLINAYGPTEVTVCASLHTFEAGDMNTNIGKPLANVCVYVLDQDLNPVSIGLPGELYIGGDGVARGYLNQEELTQERFIANPFASQEDRAQGRNLRLYKTGDLVKWLPDGNLVYLGRMDFQVKLRGYRIELGEIESVLSGYGGVAQCVVLMQEAKEEKHLVAYYVLDSESGTDEITKEALRSYLQTKLPEYMVPSFFVQLEKLPLTVHGKVDRRALPEPDVRGQIAQGYVSPRTETEHKLCQVWQKVLGLEQIGVQDNFFHIGGDSILSIQVVSKAREMGLALQVQDIFAAPTIAQLAMRVQSLTDTQADQGLVQGLCPLLPIQEWFFDQHYEYPHHWNQAQLLKVDERIDPDQLRAALDQLVAQHDSLRLRYRQRETGSMEQYYSNDATSTYCLETLDLSDIPSAMQAARIASWGTFLQGQLNYETGPVMAVGIIQGHVDGSDRLLLAIHHLVVDGVSWRILLPDLQALYSGGSLPSKTHSYQAWANALLAYAQNKSVAEEGLAYWHSVEEKLLSVQLPYKPGASLSQPTRGYKVFDLVLDSALTDQLLHKTSHAYNTQINDLLLTAFALALGSLSEAHTRERLVGFRLEGHGREQIDTVLDLSRTVGWFTSLYPVSLSLPATADLHQLIPSIKEQLRSIPDKGLSYGVLAYLHPDESVRAQLHPDQLPRVSFNYLGQFDQSLQEQNLGWQLTGELSGDALDQRNHLSNHLDVNGFVLDNQLCFTLAYSPAHFTAETIKILQEQFEQRLKEIVNHCTQRKECYATPSDYPLVDLNQSSLDALLAEARTHGEVEELYPATPLQAGLLFHALHSPSSDQYSVQLQWTYEGALDAEALKRAWQEVIGQHAILRTGFNWSQGDVLQVVYRSLPLDWESIDLSELSAAEQATQVELIQQADLASGFSLDHPPLFRFKLLRLQADRHVFLFHTHHILLDGWSNPILFKQVHETYERLIQGKGVPYYPIVPYSSYITWLKEQDQALAQSYWQGQLSGIERATDIGIRRANVQLGSNKPIEELGKLTHVYSAKETDQLQTFVQGQQVTLNTLVQLAWGRLLHTYSGGADRTVHGMVASGRSHSLAGMDQLVGLLINTLPVVLEWGEEVSIAGQLKQLHEQVQQINHYSYISLAEVQQYAMLSGGSLFHSLVVFENYPLESPGEGSVIVSGVKSFEKTNYPLTLTAYVTGGELHLAIGYDQGVFEGGSIERLLVHLRSLLTGFMADPEASPQGVSLLTSSEYEEVVYEWNQTAAPYPQDKTVHELFEDQVAKAPDKVAVVFEDEELTYGELNGRANQVARAIQKVYQGQTGESLRADTLIGISVEASLEMVIGMLGILKAGGGYVPIDPAYPAERIQYILSDTSAQVLLTQGHLSHIHSVAAQMPDSISMLYLDQGACYSKEAASNLPSVSGAHDLAYVIYTSGTTGKPKGVMIEHQQVVRLVKGQDYIDFENRVFAQAANIAFDAATFEIWAPLLSNAQLVIMKHAQVLEASLLSKQIQEYHVDTLWLTASLFDQLVSYNVDTLNPIKQLLVGGDIVSLASCRKLLVANPSCQLVNGYGPTEGTVFSTTYLINSYHEPQGPIPIGSGLHNTTLYVLGPHLQPVPLGVSGELYIGGDGVARGYLNQEELTQERFIANPFASQEDKSQGRNLRLYKTGDLVKWLPDGNLVYLGRRDFQVKLRGYRIELGEIESVLSGYGGIVQCVVLMHEAKEEKYLVAYYVLDAGTDAVTPDTLRSYLQARLPEYMVPSFFVQLEAIPLTVNGKVDRRALPEPDIRGQIAQGYVAPSNEVEQLIQHIWSQVLGLEQIGVYDNFFHIGGHSLKATQVAARLQQTLAKACPVKWLFEYPTIKTLADQLQGGQAAQKVVIPRSEEVGQTVLSYAQKRLWFIDQYQQQQSTNYHIPVVWQLRGALQVSALEQALNQLIERHQSLRTVFRQDASGNAYQMILPLESCQVSLAAEEVSAQERDQRIAMTIQEPFDLAADRLVRVRLLAIVEAGASNPSSQGKGQALERVYTLVIVQHHIVSDGWSMGIWVKELGELYNAALEGRQARLPALSIQYRDYASWEQEYLQGERLQAMLSYWQGQLQGYEDLQLPTDNPRPAVQTYQGAHSQFYIDAQLTEQLKGLCRETGSTLYMVLLAGFSLLLSRYSGQRDIVIGSPIANRWHPQLEHLIGFFVNTLVLRIKTGIQSVEELLEQVKQTTLSAYEHQSLPFEYLVDQLVVERNQSRSPIFQVMFVLQHASEVVTPSLSGVEVEAVPFSYEVSKFDMTLWLVEGEDGIGGYIEYNPGLYNGSTIAQLASHLKRLLVAMVSHRGGDIASLPLLTSEEYQQIVYGWNQTSVVYPQDKTIHELFEDQVSKTPEKVAVVFEDEELTYGELNGRANQLARAIQKAYQDQTGESLKADTLIGICVEASLDMVIGILGILKSGGGYVPIDPSYPAERIQYILADTRVQVLLTQNNLTLGQPSVLQRQSDPISEVIPPYPCILYLDQAACYSKEATSNLPPVSGAQDLAYVIYTSGTTGKPKGALLTHRNLNNLVINQITLLNLSVSSRVLQFSAIGFDAFVWETYSTLVAGGSLYIVDDTSRKLPAHLGDYIQQNQLNVITIPPALLEQFPKMTLPALQVLIVAGESCHQAVMEHWHQGRKLINAYGPTEITVCASLHTFEAGDMNTKIGRPLANVCVYVLDQDLNPVPLGVSGELYIGGDGVARGYLNQEELTQERFIANPFASQEDRAQGRNLRLYKTGDLVKWLPDGNLVYLGRRDFQVKLRGYRIELGEIESVLSGYAGIAQCVVLMHEAKEEKHLVAYYVLDDESGSAAVTTDTLRSYLQAKLPMYMVPSFFVQLEELPLTVNGKVDRRALPEPDVRGQIAQGYVAPRTETEHKLCEVWQTVLGLDRVGVQDNFFHIGGHSLLAVQLINRLNQALHLNLPVSWVFTHQHIAAQAEAIAHRVDYNQAIVVYNQQEGHPPLFLFHTGLAGAEVYYEMAQLLQKHHISVYGVNSYNIAHPEHPIESFDQLTAYYAQEITKIYPGKRLFLGGWSLGGSLSYGVYHHLLKQGKEVDCIFMIDTILSQDDLHADENNDMLDVDLKEVALKLMPEQVVNEFYQHLEDAEYIAKITRASVIHRNMFQHFRLQGRVNKIVLFKASESKFDASAWKQWADQLDIIGIESDHVTIMKANNLQTIVKHMAEAISQQLCIKS